MGIQNGEPNSVNNPCLITMNGSLRQQPRAQFLQPDSLEVDRTRVFLFSCWDAMVVLQVIDVNIFEVLTGAKSNPYVCSWVVSKQSMEFTNDDDNDISIHCANQACRRALSKSVLKVKKHPGICFFVVT